MKGISAFASYSAPLIARKQHHSSCMVGVVRAGIDPGSVNGGLYATRHGWMYRCDAGNTTNHGRCYHNGHTSMWASSGKHTVTDAVIRLLVLLRYFPQGRCK